MIKPDFSAEHLLPSFSAVFPYLSISIVVIGYIVAFAINKFDLALNGIYLTAPLVIASIIILKWPNLDINFINNNFKVNKHNILISALAYTLFYLLTILVLLIYNERVIIYFILITIIFCIIMIQIFSSAFNNKILEYIVLTEIFLLLLNLIWGVTLKYPLYFGSTDILPHIAMVNSIIVSGHVSEFMDLYQFFPLYHILAAMGIFISNTQLETGFFIFLGLAYITVLMFAYLFFKTITKDTKISLLSLLIFSFAKEVLFYGMYMITRSMAFIFFIIILYLLIKKRPLEFGFKFILLILTMSLILTHQVTLTYVSIILIVMLILNRYIYDKNEQKNLFLKYIFLFIVSSSAYWLYVAFGFITQTFRSFRTSETVTPIAIVTVQESAFSFIQNHIVIAISIFFITFGFATLLNIKKVDKDLVFISALGILFFPFSTTDILYTFPQAMDRFLAYRIPLLMAIFITLPIVYGVLIFHKILCRNIVTKQKYFFIIISLLIVYLFFSIASPTIVSDSNDFPSSKSENTPYLTKNELIAFSYVKNKMSEPVLYSDYQASRYFYNYTSFILTEEDIKTVQSGYFILRYGELQSRYLTLGMTKFAIGKKYDNKLNSTNEPIQNILNILYKKNRIYDNSDVIIYSFKT
jgi:uncharacterized membrane protein